MQQLCMFMLCVVYVTLWNEDLRKTSVVDKEFNACGGKRLIATGSDFQLDLHKRKVPVTSQTV